MANSALGAKETVVTAVVEKGPVPAGLTGPDLARHEKAKEIRDEVQRTKDPRPVLERLTTPQPADIRRAEKAIDDNIGTHRDENAQKTRPDSGEQDRKKQGDYLKTMAVDLQNKGYDRMDPTQKSMLRGYMREAVNQLPALKAHLEAYGTGPAADAQRAAKIEEWLRDPEWQKKVLPTLIDRASNAQLEDKVTEKQAKFDDKEAAEQTAKEAFSKNETRRTEIGTELKKFDPDTTTVPPTPGEYQKELDDIKGKEGTIVANLGRLNNELSDLQLDKNNVEAQFKAQLSAKTQDPAEQKRLSDEMKRIAKDIRDKEKEIQTEGAPLRRRQELLEAQRNLKAEQKLLEEAAPGLKKAFDAATREKISAKTDLAIAKQDREEEEKNFIDNLRRSFVDTAVEKFSDQLGAAEKAQQTLLEKEAAEAMDPAKKAVLEGLAKRYKKIDIKGRKMDKVKVTFNKDLINHDYARLVKHGPNAIIRDMLIANGIVGPDQDAVFANKDLIAEMQGKVSEQLLGDKVKTGKITDAEAALFFDTDWGKSALTNAIKHNSGLDAEVNSLREQGLIKDTPDLLDKVKKHSLAGGLALGGLAALLAAIFVPLGAAGYIAGAAGLTGGGGMAIGRAMSA